MDISNCTFSLYFQPIPGIRRAAFEIEDKLKQDGYLAPFQVYPIPDEAPFELPRISAATKNGHSTLTVAAQSAQVQSQYDENFYKDFKKSLEYSKEKAIGLFNALSSMDDILIQFTGLSAQLLTSATDINGSPVNFIEEKYLNVSSKLEMSDAAMKIVYNVDDNLYLNLEIKKVIMADPISINIGADSVSVMKQLAQHDEMLAVSIDFNNRLAFNNAKPEGCDLAIIESFYSRMLAFLDDGLEAFLNDGEVRF